MICSQVKWNLLAMFAIYVLTVSACNANNGNERIIEDLQKQVPYTIIVPSYLPDGFYRYPSQIGEPSKGPYNSIGFSLIYKKRGNPQKIIVVKEANYSTTFYPSKPSSIFLDIRGLNVLEEETELLIPPGQADNIQMLTGFLYAWNSGEINLVVDIFGYGKEECRRVIESMIE